jgi:hypothetical protein
MQRRFYRYNYLIADHLPHCPQRRREVEKKSAHCAPGQLWERRVTDDDFGVIRLGMGTLPSTVTYVLGKVEILKTPGARA